jgi:hypothetical protein
MGDRCSGTWVTLVRPERLNKGSSMPWTERSAMDQREEFVRLASAPGANRKELCRRFGISRKTGYKLLHRCAVEGRAGLADRSRRPRQPVAVRPTVEDGVFSVHNCTHHIATIDLRGSPTSACGVVDNASALPTTPQAHCNSRLKNTIEEWNPKCHPCPRTPVTHLGLYTLREGVGGGVCARQRVERVQSARCFRRRPSDPRHRLAHDRRQHAPHDPQAGVASACRRETPPPTPTRKGKGVLSLRFSVAQASGEADSCL